MRLIKFIVAAALLASSIGASADVLYGLGNTDLFGEARRSSNLYIVDETTGAASLIGATGTNLRGMTVDHTTGRAYASGSSYNTSGGLYEIDLNTGAASFIGGTQNLHEMVFDTAGNLFGWSSRGSGFYDFYSVDVATGAESLIATNAINASLWSASLDMTTGEWVFLDYIGLGEVNQPTGSFSRTVSSLFYYSPQFSIDSSGDMYFVDRNSTTSLYSIDDAGVRSLIGGNGVGLNSLAFGEHAVPEPGTLALFGLGLAGIGLSRRRRNA